MLAKGPRKITSHFGRPCIPSGGVAKTRNIKNIPAFSRLAGRTPARPILRSYYCANPKEKNDSFISLFFGRMVSGLLSAITFISEQTKTIASSCCGKRSVRSPTLHDNEKRYCFFDGGTTSVSSAAFPQQELAVKGALNEDTIFMYCGIPLVFLGGMFHARCRICRVS